MNKMLIDIFDLNFSNKKNLEINNSKFLTKLICILNRQISINGTSKYILFYIYKKRYLTRRKVNLNVDNKLLQTNRRKSFYNYTLRSVNQIF